MKFCHDENEAFKKRCPAMMGGPVAQPHCHCVGSNCMAWRWVETNINHAPGEPLEPSYDTHGYCGLAGDPRPPMWRTGD